MKTVIFINKQYKKDVLIELIENLKNLHEVFGIEEEEIIVVSKTKYSIDGVTIAEDWIPTKDSQNVYFNYELEEISNEIFVLDMIAYTKDEEMHFKEIFTLIPGNEIRGDAMDIIKDLETKKINSLGFSEEREIGLVIKKLKSIYNV